MSAAFGATIEPTRAGATAGSAGITPTRLLRMYRLSELGLSGSLTFCLAGFGWSVGFVSGLILDAVLVTTGSGKELSGTDASELVTKSGGSETGAV